MRFDESEHSAICCRACARRGSPPTDACVHVLAWKIKSTIRAWAQVKSVSVDGSERFTSSRSGAGPKLRKVQNEKLSESTGAGNGAVHKYCDYDYFFDKEQLFFSSLDYFIGTILGENRYW